MMKFFDSPSRLTLTAVCCALIAVVEAANIGAAELPLVRIAHGAFSEKVVALWLGNEQGLFRKHGVN
ncbi:MAG: hypothetical protein ACXWW4_08840, partial [Candidatus Binatia bacterium]